MAVPFSTHALHAARTLARFSIAAVVLALPYGHAGADLTYVRVARVQVEEIDTRREIVHETPDTGFVTTNTATSFRDVQTATGGVRLIDTNTGRPINVSDEAASASIAGHLDYGRIGVTAQTRAAVSRLGFPFQHVEASAASLTAWFDSITFTADTLPAGTLLEVRLSSSFDYSLTDVAGTLGDLANVARVEGTVIVNGVGSGFQCGRRDTACEPGFNTTTFTQVLQARVGETWSVGQDLLVDAADRVGLATQPLTRETVIADASVAFALEVLTPGVSYRADSGTIFPTALAAVPEPTTQAILIVGGALLLAGGLCKRRPSRTMLRLRTRTVERTGR